MVHTTQPRRILQFAVAASVALVPAAALASQAHASPPAASVKQVSHVSAAPAKVKPAKAHPYTAGRYIVTFTDDPVASYTGYAKGYPATHPGRGHKVDPNSSAVAKWRDHLTARHDSAMAEVGAAKLYDFTVTNNAVTADLSAKQATELSKMSGVLALSKDKLSHPDTTYSPQFLGLNAPGGIWSQLGGGAHAGAGIVVGVLDTGIWPENPSFAPNPGIPVPATWHGQCVAGEQFPVTKCNGKIVGARYYLAGFGKHSISKDEYQSPRDGDGHGSHTSSTAAGDYNVPITIDGKSLGNASGMAPGAKIAMYKVCWTGKAPIPGGCFTSDSVAAINDAVLDGVDVINYSIGGTTEADIFDPVAQAFRGAANANVFVANSAGNSGPGASTLDHPSPWVTTVAAATFRRAFQVVQLGNGARYVGASTTGPLTTLAPLVTAASVKLASAATGDAALCFAGSLDPAKAAGKVVVCDRGVNARLDKGFEVKRVGGVGMVLANTSANSLNGDFHPVPAVHVNNTDGAAIKAYITSFGAAATAKIVPLTAPELAAAPQVPEITDFSSRGPSTTTGGDILKPDIAAPGNDVVAAVAPPFWHGRQWDFMSGTSMASPHIAGIGALVKARHPNWLPSEIKSAIMTSATDTVSSANDPFAQGAGFVNPNGAADPGLVYPTTPNEWRQYMISQGALFNPPFADLDPISGPDLNQASIAIGSLAGTATVPRHVRNVGTSTATYTATASVPGFTVQVTPASLTLAPDATGNFTVSFTRSTAPFDTYAKGSLTWTDGTHSVRIPIAVRPVPVAVPTEVHGAASASGSTTFSVTPGFTGSLANTVSGLVGVTPIADSVATGPFDIDNPAVDAGTKVYHAVVPLGTRAARFSLDSDDNTADLDLFAYVNGNFVDLSASGSADEQITLIDPPDGNYDIYVNGFTTPGGSTAYHLANFVVPSADAGNAAVTPNPVAVTVGVPTTLTASWSGLDPAKRWFGVVNYTTTNTVTIFSVG